MVEDVGWIGVTGLDTDLVQAHTEALKLCVVESEEVTGGEEACGHVA